MSALVAQPGVGLRALSAVNHARLCEGGHCHPACPSVMPDGMPGKRRVSRPSRRRGPSSRRVTRNSHRPPCPPWRHVSRPRIAARLVEPLAPAAGRQGIKSRGAQACFKFCAGRPGRFDLRVGSSPHSGRRGAGPGCPWPLIPPPPPPHTPTPPLFFGRLEGRSKRRQVHVRSERSLRPVPGTAGPTRRCELDATPVLLLPHTR